MAKKRLYSDSAYDDKDSEGEPRVSPLENFIGDLSKTHGLEQESSTPPGEPKSLSYPQAHGRILAGPPKEVPNIDQKFVRFYDDTTDQPDLSLGDKLAMIAIGLATPMAGYALGGKLGGYAGGAAAAKGIGGALDERQDYYNKMKANKFANKSKIMTAAELRLLGGTDGGGGLGKVKYQWLPGRNARGELVYRRVDRVTGEIDKESDINGYRKEYYENYVPGSGTESAFDSSGAEMPPPEAHPKPSMSPGAGPPATNREDDATFNYDRVKPQPKTTNVAGKLPSHIGPAKEPLMDSSSAKTLAADYIAQLNEMMPSDRELDPTPMENESISSGRMRADNAGKMRLKILDKQAEINKGVISGQKDIEKEGRGETRSKALAKYKLSLDKDLATFKNTIKQPSAAKQEKRQVMKNAKGQLIDVATGEVVDASETAPRVTGGAKSGAIMAKQEDKIAQFDTAIADMEDVLNKAKSNWIGVIDSKLPAVDPAESAFRSSVGQQTDSYRHVITGAGAGMRELKQLEGRLPTPSDVSLEVFRAKGNAYIEKMRRARDIYAKSHGMSAEGPDKAAIKANLNEQKTQLAPDHTGMVEFTAPNGTKAWIPKEREEYYKKKAAGGQ